MSKQVQSIATTAAAAGVLASAALAVASEVANNSTPQQKNLYVSVKTFNDQGQTIGERIVDQYHFGTRNWLQNHLWWAMHNAAEVEIKLASEKEINDYLSNAAVQLAEKFNSRAPAAAEKVAA